MTSHFQVCTRWVEILKGSTRKQTKGSRVYAEGDTIFSYGRHFPMARALRDKAGNVRLVLVNGDVFSVSTNGHQSELRSALAVSGLPQAIIPFTALAAAGVEQTSVEVIQVTPDRHDTIEHVTTVQPDRSVWKTHPVMAYVDLTPEQLQALADGRNARAMQDYERKIGYALAEQAEGETMFWQQWLADRSVVESPVEVTVESLSDYDRRVYRQVGTEQRLHRSPITNATIDVSIADDGQRTYRWTTYKHWLGESVIRGSVSTSTRKVCKTCRGSGRTSDYDRTSADRFEARFLCEPCRGLGGSYLTRTRKTVFLSGFDHQEPRPLYFFCELPPRSKPTTVAEAYEMLKPDTVKLAEQMSRPVVRQGDIFAVAMAAMTKRDLTKAGATYEKRGTLLGTNHKATEVAYLPDGTTLARGTLIHDPGFRDPDHVRKTLGKSWHVTIKNTVPVTA